MPQRAITYAEVVTESEQTHAALEANAADFPHMEEFRDRLGKLLGEARDLSKQQSSLTASKQETSKRLQAVVDEIFKLTTFLRTSIKQRYGSRSEKLVEFGMQPFRGLSRKPKGEPADKKQAATQSPNPPPDLP